MFPVLLRDKLDVGKGSQSATSIFLAYEISNRLYSSYCESRDFNGKELCDFSVSPV